MFVFKKRGSKYGKAWEQVRRILNLAWEQVRKNVGASTENVDKFSGSNYEPDSEEDSISFNLLTLKWSFSSIKHSQLVT